MKALSGASYSSTRTANRPVSDFSGNSSKSRLKLSSATICGSCSIPCSIIAERTTSCSPARTPSGVAAQASVIRNRMTLCFPQS